MITLDKYTKKNSGYFEIFTIENFKEFVKFGYINDWDGSLFRVSNSNIVHDDLYIPIKDLNKFPDTTHVIWISK